MTRRYYVPDLTDSSPIVSMPDEEASHAARVMRLQLGDAVELFDGQGHQAAGEVISISKRECVVRCQTPVIVDREPSVTLDLAVAIPKPDRAKEMIERLTELGVARVIPITFERTQRPPTDSLLEKLRRIVIESCKQSGRNQRMDIDAPIDFAVFVDSIESGPWRQACVAMPDSLPLTNRPILPPGDPDQTPHLLAIIGPEGGLSVSEQDRCEKLSISFVGLGRRILRIETAAAVVAARCLID